MSDKITEKHLHRKAILYVRQSSAQQLVNHTESRRLQYAMRQRLEQLGWREIEVIDEDLGRSASGSVERSGFERLVVEVSLGNVGAVAAREVSRFARNSRDWQQLMEVSRVVDTLLVDQEAVYDPRNGNDRLLLGLKGSLNEYELDLLRLRGHEARRAKAKRGEYFARIAVGYCKSEDGILEKTPDARVGKMVELVFEKMLELGSARQVLHWLHDKGLELPVNRNHHGQVTWKVARYDRLYCILINPVYAGAYVYGRNVLTARLENGRTRKRYVRKPLLESAVLLRGHHEAYIDWDRFERIQSMLARNSNGGGGPGAPHRGEALLAGLVRCRRCGQKMRVEYSGASGTIHRYSCARRHTSHGEPRCVNFSGREVDLRIERELLRVVSPAAIEVSMQAAELVASSNDEAYEAMRLELEAARYAAERARRQYDAVDPENRTVASELERRWESALQRTRELEARMHEHTSVRAATKVPSPEVFVELAHDLPAVWNAATTDNRLKKRIVRTLVHEVVADIDEGANEIVVLIHWKGGAHTEHRVPRRKRGYHGKNTNPNLVEAVRTLSLVCSDDEIAAWLSRNGQRTATGKSWNRQLVAALRSKNGISVFSEAECELAGWLTLSAAAKLVGVADKTLMRAVERGDATAIRPLPHGPWIFQRAHFDDPAAVARLKKRNRPSAPNGGSGQTSKQLDLVISRR
jgi:DNA invertase Pin-like site-specific DNA recombinase